MGRRSNEGGASAVEDLIQPRLKGLEEGEGVDEVVFRGGRGKVGQTEARPDRPAGKSDRWIMGVCFVSLKPTERVRSGTPRSFPHRPDRG